MNILVKDIKMMNYGLQKKQGIGMSVFFFVLGTIFELVPGMSMGSLGGYYVLLVAMFPVQLLQLLGVSSMYASSPLYSQIERKGVVIFGSVGTIISYAYYIGLKFLRIYVIDGGVDASEKLRLAATSMIIVGICAGVLQIYNVLAYKYFVISLVMLFIVLIPSIVFASVHQSRNLYFECGFGASVAIGYGVIIIGIILAAVFSYLLRKKPLDSFTYKRAISMAMK